MRRKPKYPDMVLKVTFHAPSGPGGYCHIRGRVERADNEMIYSSDPGWPIRGVRFNAQSDTAYLAEAGGEREQAVYGYDVTWLYEREGDGSIGLRDLRDLRDGLKAVGAAKATLDQVEFKDGRASSFGEWVARLVGVLGVGAVRFQATSGEWIDIDAEAAGRRVNRRIAEWQAIARRQTQAAAV